MSEPRGHWRSNTGFILAATGSAIGLGNLWKFPFITWENNGGAFVLVYLVCIAAVGLPIMMAELLIGRSTQKSVVGALKEAIGPAWGIVGLWGVLCGFLLLSYYTVIAGWSLFYFAKSAGWLVGGFPAGASMGELFGAQAANGGLQLGLSLGFSIATVSIVYCGVQKGIERIARVFLPILFGILVLLLVSALEMAGAGEALGFIFRPRFGELDGGSVLEALGHAFFTLSLGMGAMVTYGSYIAKHQSIVKASAIIVVLDTLIALVATVIMFSVIFSVPGMDEQVSGTGTVGMLFISLPPAVLHRGPVRGIPGATLLRAGGARGAHLDDVAAGSGRRLRDRRTPHAAPPRRRCCVAARCSPSRSSPRCRSGVSARSPNSNSAARSGQILFGGKASWFGMVDHFVSNWMLPTGGFAITIAAGWFLTREYTERELVDGTEPGWFNYGTWRFFIQFVSPLAVAANHHRGALLRGGLQLALLRLSDIPIAQDFAAARMVHGRHQKAAGELDLSARRFDESVSET